jgi:drug/metabolite transporter (DMT)-like permease
MTDRMKGLIYTGGGIMFLSPDALIIKMSGLDGLSMIFWRGLLSGISLGLILIIAWRGTLWSHIRSMGRPGLLVVIFYAISNSCFTMANTHTVAANVLVIVATTPLFSAIFAAMFLKEPTSPRIWIASLIALGGVGLVAGEQVSLNAGLGELYALVCVLGISIVFVVIRSAKEVNMLPATALALAITMPLGLFFYAEPVGAIPWAFVLIGNLIFIPIAYIGITVGPRYLPPAETGLLLLLETVFGSLWVWLVLSERPTDLGLIGGVVILVTLIVNTLITMHLERRSVPA